MRAKLGFAAGLAMLAAPLAPAEPITALNWQRHQAIAEIRAIYREIKDLVRDPRRAFDKKARCEGG